jgi:hypothetical protein
VISQFIGSVALCAFQTATFGRLPQRIGIDNDMGRSVMGCHVMSMPYSNSGKLFRETRL